MVEADAQLQVKKRARRRLVGAVAFASLAAIVLPVVMDQEPRQPVQDVEIRIPGQNEKPFTPKLKATPPPVETAPVNTPAPPPAPVPAPEPAPKQAAPLVAPLPAAIEAKPAPEKKAEKPAKAEKPEKSDKPAAKSNDDDAKRAAAILGGKAKEAAPSKESYAILIGAFSNPGNVKNLQQKLAEQGIKTWTENLDAPGGSKTRVRAGPFSSKDAAEKALDKMKRIGVSGVISSKQ